MHIPLDRESNWPLFRQIEDYLRQNILSGNLPPETRLPATRQLAEQLGVSRITVKNAYSELESDGLIGSLEGSGTYVMSLPSFPESLGNETEIAWPLWQSELTMGLEQAVSTFLPGTRPGLISFTGVGDPRYFPTGDFSKAMLRVLRRDGLAALEYGNFDGGYPPLRDTIAHILASQGINAKSQEILVTSGSQQSIALVCQALLKPGDTVLVEKPTYNFALDLFRALKLKIVGIPVDDKGMQVGVLESFLQKYHPKLLYTIPNFQNPSGVCMSAARRRKLLVLAACYNLPVLEDDFVGDLRYDGRSQPAIKALDPGGFVIYTGTFSKMLMPGLRVGYLVARGPVFHCLSHLKLVSDLTTSTLIQRTLEEFVTIGRYQAHLRRSQRLYRSRRDAMMAAIHRYLPEAVKVYSPQGGLFIWMKLPEPLSSLELLVYAHEAGVDYAPGPRFFPDPEEGKGYLRLNFAVQTLEDIDKGIMRLGMAMERLAAE
jgi:GntR family transcriptional regulator / MocR family aminotransferase